MVRVRIHGATSIIDDTHREALENGILLSQQKNKMNMTTEMKRGARAMAALQPVLAPEVTANMNNTRDTGVCVQTQ